MPAPLHGLCRERAKGLCTRVCKHQLYQASECQGGLLLLSGPWALPGQHAEAGVQSAGTSSWVPASQAQEHRTSAHEAKMFGQGPGWVALKSRNCPTYPENLAKNTPSLPRFISQIPGTCAPPPGDGQTRSWWRENLRAGCSLTLGVPQPPSSPHPPPPCHWRWPLQGNRAGFTGAVCPLMLTAPWGPWCRTETKHSSPRRVHCSARSWRTQWA